MLMRFSKPTALANERSKSPLIITKAKPKANTPPIEVVKSILVILEVVKKLSDKTEKNIIKKIKAINNSLFLINSAKLLLKFFSLSIFLIYIVLSS